MGRLGTIESKLNGLLGTVPTLLRMPTVLADGFNACNIYNTGEYVIKAEAGIVAAFPGLLYETFLISHYEFGDFLGAFQFAKMISSAHDIYYRERVADDHDWSQFGSTWRIFADQYGIPPKIGSEINGLYSSAELRLRNIDNQLSSCLGQPLSGDYFDNAYSNLATGTNAPGAGIIRLQPFTTVFNNPNIDQIGLNVTTAGTAGTYSAIIAIYESNPLTGWPTGAPSWSATITGLNATGYKYATPPNGLNGGRLYWIAVHMGCNATISSLALGSSQSLGLNGSAGTAYFTSLQRSLAWGSALPNFTTTPVVAADKSVNPPISIRMRKS